MGVINKCWHWGNFGDLSNEITAPPPASPPARYRGWCLVASALCPFEHNPFTHSLPQLSQFHHGCKVSVRSHFSKKSRVYFIVVSAKSYRPFSPSFFTPSASSFSTSSWCCEKLSTRLSLSHVSKSALRPLVSHHLLTTSWGRVRASCRYSMPSQ